MSDEIRDEAAEEISFEEALGYLQGSPQFKVFLDQVRLRKADIENGMRDATSEDAQRLCGQLVECSDLLRMAGVSSA